MSKIKLEDLKYVGLKENRPTETVEEISEETAVVETTLDEEISEVLNVTAPVVEKLRPEIVKVNNLKIYSKPSTKIPARSFTGNVEIIGHVESFTIVKYVRPGFGSIKGYTLEI